MSLYSVSPYGFEEYGFHYDPQDAPQKGSNSAQKAATVASKAGAAAAAHAPIPSVNSLLNSLSNLKISETETTRTMRLCAASAAISGKPKRVRNRIGQEVQQLVKAEITEKDLTDFIKNHPYTEKLTLRAKQFKEEHLSLLHSLSKLRILRLQVPSLTEVGFSWLGKLKKLRSLQLVGIQSIKEVRSDTFFRMEGLRHLEIDNCKSLSSVDYKSILEPLSQLITLTLRNLVLSDGLLHCIYFKKLCLNLRAIIIDGCSGFSEKYLTLFLQPFSDLQQCRISNCAVLTGSALAAFLEKKKFRYLSINKCRNLTSKGVQSLITCKSLEILRITNCLQCTHKTIKKLERHPKARIFGVDRATGSNLSVRSDRRTGNEIIAYHKARKVIIGKYWLENLPEKIQNNYTNAASRRSECIVEEAPSTESKIA